MLQSIENSIEFENFERTGVKERSRVFLKVIKFASCYNPNATYIVTRKTSGERDLSLESVLLSLKEHFANLLRIDPFRILPNSR